MSLENHPNFQAIKFTTDIVSSYYDSLRGKVNNKNAPDISELVKKFCSDVEELVDQTADSFVAKAIDKDKYPNFVEANEGMLINYFDCEPTSKLLFLAELIGSAALVRLSCCECMVDNCYSIPMPFTKIEHTCSKKQQKYFVIFEMWAMKPKIYVSKTKFHVKEV